MVSIDSLFEAGPPKVGTPEYRRGHERIFGKKAQARREKEVSKKKKEQEAKVKKKKAEADKRRKQQKKRSEKKRVDKVNTLEKARIDRKAKDAERKSLIKKNKRPKQPLGLNQIPAQIAHCMMAVHVKRKKSKQAAWNICRWAMTKYGYLKGPYRKNTKLPKAVKQTQKGVRRSFQHGMEKGPLGGGLPGTGISKYNRFIKMFKDVEGDFVPKKAR